MLMGRKQGPKPIIFEILDTVYPSFIVEIISISTLSLTSNPNFGLTPKSEDGKLNLCHLTLLEFLQLDDNE